MRPDAGKAVRLYLRIAGRTAPLKAVDAVFLQSLLIDVEVKAGILRHDNSAIAEGERRLAAKDRLIGIPDILRKGARLQNTDLLISPMAADACSRPASASPVAACGAIGTFHASHGAPTLNMVSSPTHTRISG
jgi:hypothetical protein